MHAAPEGSIHGKNARPHDRASGCIAEAVSLRQGKSGNVEETVVCLLRARQIGIADLIRTLREKRADAIRVLRGDIGREVVPAVYQRIHAQVPVAEQFRADPAAHPAPASTERQVIVQPGAEVVADVEKGIAPLRAKIVVVLNETADVADTDDAGIVDRVAQSVQKEKAHAIRHPLLYPGLDTVISGIGARRFIFESRGTRDAPALVGSNNAAGRGLIRIREKIQVRALYSCIE